MKQWHWIAIGIIVGAVLAYARFTYPGGANYEVRSGLDAASFVELAEDWDESEHPPLLDLVVHPALDGKNYVTGQYLRRVRRGEAEYWEFELNAAIPFTAPGAAAPPGEHFTIRDYLDQVAERHPGLSYRYAWWNRPGVSAAAWGVGAAVVIGGLWPVMLNLLIGAGFVRKPEPKEPEYDLERFKSEPEPAKPSAAELDEHEIARLRAVEQELERKLTAGGASPAADGAAAGEVNQSAPAPVKPLTGGPLQPQAGSDGPEDPKEYQGEFYPVAKPGRPPNEKP